MFKVGDWVRLSCRDYITQITDIFDEKRGYRSRYSIKCKDYERGIDSSYTPEQLKLWQPKEGEWCWFKDNSYNTAVLARFAYIDEDGEFEANLDGLYRPFINIEPFIGELPSFIEE